MPVVRVPAKIEIAMECPPQMEFAVRDVLGGEYETGCDGEGLDILDIGANVGSFARWSELRWPGSRIRSYEPNPGTFAMLKRNVAGQRAIRPINAAVFPGLGGASMMWSRYAGDGEAGLTAYSGETFAPGAEGETFKVKVVDPASLGSADVVKIDIEGGEGDVLAALDLSRTSLVLTEFQNRKNRDQMRAVLARDFEPILDEDMSWDPLLDYKDYRADLKGDVFGHMYYWRKGATRMRRA